MTKTINIEISVDGNRYPVTAEFSDETDTGFEKDQTIVRIRKADIPVSLRLGNVCELRGFGAAGSVTFARALQPADLKWILSFQNP